MVVGTGFPQPIGDTIAKSLSRPVKRVKSRFMKFCEFLKTLKRYFATDLPEAQFYDRVFGYCLEDPGADIACEYSRVEKHYFFTGQSEPCFLAEKILKYFDEETFAYHLYEEVDDGDIPNLINDFGIYGVELDSKNWDSQIASLLKSILERSSASSRSFRIHGNLKLRAALMEENPSGICPCPNCSNPLRLSVEDESESYSLLQTFLLDCDGPKSVSNAIGICNECFQRGKYDLNALRIKKNEFVRIRKAYAELDDPLFPERLTNAAKKLKSAKSDQLKRISYKALRVNRKILPDNTMLLSDIEDKVTRFFPFLMECFSEDDGLDGYSYDELSKSIRAIFESANAECATQEEVFETISKKIAAVVDETENVGRVIVAYFVQTCEVFNEIPE